MTRLKPGEFNRTSSKNRTTAGCASPAAAPKPVLPCVAPIYSDTLLLLEDAWRRTSDAKSCRPFLRLCCGRLLQLKSLVELCFTEGFAPAHHGVRLSELAINVYSALQTHDASMLWSSLQILDSPEGRVDLVGKNRSVNALNASEAACTILQLQGYTALLFHPWKPLEGNDCPVDEALRRMNNAIDLIPTSASTEVCCLIQWELIHCADRIFRHVLSTPEVAEIGICPSKHRLRTSLGSQSAAGLAEPGGKERERAAPFTASAAEMMQTWAVRSVAEVSIWRGGDPYGAIVAVLAVRTLIRWHGLLSQKDAALRKTTSSRDIEKMKKDAVLMKVERILARVSAHCACLADTDEVAKEEAKAITMLLNDHNLAGAPELAATCLLHSTSKQAKDTKDVRLLAARLSRSTSGSRPGSASGSTSGSRPGSATHSKSDRGSRHPSETRSPRTPTSPRSSSGALSPQALNEVLADEGSSCQQNRPEAKLVDDGDAEAAAYQPVTLPADGDTAFLLLSRVDSQQILASSNCPRFEALQHDAATQPASPLTAPAEGNVHESIVDEAAVEAEHTTDTDAGRLAELNAVHDSCGLPEEVVSLTAGELPPLGGTDAAWGPAARLDDTPGTPQTGVVQAEPSLSRFSVNTETIISSLLDGFPYPGDGVTGDSIEQPVTGSARCDRASNID